MLIYARKEDGLSTVNHAPTPNLVESTPELNSSSASINGVSRPSVKVHNVSDPSILVPPQRAQDVVQGLNGRHDEACELYSRR